MNIINKKLIEIIEQVLDGRINREEFYQSLPIEADDGTLYEDISNDIEDAIEHSLADYQNYDRDSYIKKDKDYQILVLDMELLKRELNMDLLLKIRRKIIKQGIIIDKLNEQISMALDKFKT
ncbi:MAG TPA: hypothetical protein VMT35_03380 [Ignavibacteriaceae bacterium]|nr:hypothetical protein [Ignavibacteriaceae bacterium]